MPKLDLDRSAGSWSSSLKTEAEPDFEVVFNSLPTPLLLMDRDLTIVALNEAFIKQTGLASETLIGRNVFAAFPAGQESRRLLRQSFERVRDQGIVDVVPLVSYAHVVNGCAEERLWSCTHIPVRDKSGSVVFLLKNAQDLTETSPALKEGAELCPSLKDSLAGLRSAAVSRQAGEGAVGLEVLNQTLIATVEHLRRLVMQAPSFMCVLRGPGLVFEMVNTAFSILAGGRDLIGKSLCEALPELAGQQHPRIFEAIIETGDVHVGRKTRILLEGEQEGELEEHFIDFVAQPIIGRNGEVTGIFIEGNDVTDHVRTQERQALLIRELHHRVRNTLAMVQGVLTTSANTAESFEDFRQAFCARIIALARTHESLTEDLDQSVSFGQLLAQELGPYSDEQGLRIRLNGPAIDLPSKIAVPLGMAIHELTTNAIKHGALATEGGRVEVGWQMAGKDGQPRLVCEWEEFAGEPIIPPSRQGFGSLLLNRVLAQQISAEVDAEFLPQGFKIRMVVPL